VHAGLEATTPLLIRVLIGKYPPYIALAPQLGRACVKAKLERHCSVAQVLHWI